jgi:AcrR family transcriptional regulator
MYQRVHNVEATPDIPRRLPRGTHGLAPSLVAASQRARLLEATGRAVAEKGYAAATIDDIVRGAGVSKKTFYEHFPDKLGCFLAAYEAASDELLEHVRAAQDTETDWVDSTRAGIHAYLRWLAAEPALARVFLIEIAAAGPEALERRERVRDRYAERMRELQTTNSVPDELFHAVVAAVDDLVVRRLRAGDDVRELEPTILELQLALLRGQTLNN